MNVDLTQLTPFEQAIANALEIPSLQGISGPHFDWNPEAFGVPCMILYPVRGAPLRRIWAANYGANMPYQVSVIAEKRDYARDTLDAIIDILDNGYTTLTFPAGSNQVLCGIYRQMEPEIVYLNASARGTEQINGYHAFTRYEFWTQKIFGSHE